MRVINIIRMNDWNIREFLKIIVAVQFAIFFIIYLNDAGLQISIIRQIISTIYLFFIPGIIILRILKLHRLGNIETLLYAVGLSISFIMFIGLLMNIFYPYLGISRPITAITSIITISLFVFILCILCYIVDNEFSDQSFIDISIPVITLFLIPPLSIFGVYLVNFYHTNILIILLILFLAIMPVIFDRFIPKELWPIALFVIAISLLYHRSLVSIYLCGHDIHLEYYLSNLVMQSSQWNPTIPLTTNAMLSIVMLAPIFSEISGMSLSWVFKIIYPLLFALVPLGLYCVFQKQTGHRIAFLACFYFMSVVPFFSTMIFLARQEIAELFLVLLILLIIDDDIERPKKSVLFIIFGCSLVVSHYGVTYLFLFCLIFAWPLFYLKKGVIPSSRYQIPFHKKPIPAQNGRNRMITCGSVLLFAIITLEWYIYVSGGSAFNSIVQIGDQITSSVYTSFLDPRVSQGLDIIISEKPSYLRRIAKYLYLATQFFIVVGMLDIMLNRKRGGKISFKEEYIALCIVNLILCFAAIGVPYLSNSLNTGRLFHILIILLSPFCVIGGLIILDNLFKLTRRIREIGTKKNTFGLLSVFFAIFLLFSSGFIFEISGDMPGSLSLSQESIQKYGDAQKKADFYSSYTFEQDIFCAKWLSKNYHSEYLIFADGNCYYKVLISYGMFDYNRIMPLNSMTTPKNGYVYLNFVNVVENLLPTFGALYNTTEYMPLKKAIKIYTNGGGDVYWT